MAKTIIENRFGVTPNDLLNNENISLKAKGLYAYIQSKPDFWDFTLEGIASQCKEGIESVRNAVRELEDYGYLIRKNYKDKKTGRWDCDYNLYAIPQKPKPLIIVDKLEEPHRVLPHAGEPSTENRHAKVNKISKQEEVKKINTVIQLPEWIDKDIWEEWVKHRKEIKKALTPTTISRQIKFLEANKKDYREIINNSIQGGYIGLFELRKKQINNNTVQPIKGKYEKY